MNINANLYMLQFLDPSTLIKRIIQLIRCKQDTKDGSFLFCSNLEIDFQCKLLHLYFTYYYNGYLFYDITFIKAKFMHIAKFTRFEFEIMKLLMLFLVVVNYTGFAQCASIQVFEVKNTLYPIYNQSTGLVIKPSIYLRCNTLVNQSKQIAVILQVRQVPSCSYTLDVYSNFTQNIELGFQLNCPLMLKQGHFTQDMNLTLFALAAIDDYIKFQDVPLQIQIIQSNEQYWILGYIAVAFIFIGVISYFIEKTLKKRSKLKKENSQNLDDMLDEHLVSHMSEKDIIQQGQGSNGQERVSLKRQERVSLKRQDRQKSKQYMVNVSSFTNTNKVNSLHQSDNTIEIKAQKVSFNQPECKQITKQMKRNSVCQSQNNKEIVQVNDGEIMTQKQNQENGQTQQLARQSQGEPLMKDKISLSQQNQENKQRIKQDQK